MAKSQLNVEEQKIPPGSYTRQTLPSISEAARAIVESIFTSTGFDPVRDGPKDIGTIKGAPLRLSSSKTPGLRLKTGRKAQKKT